MRKAQQRQISELLRTIKQAQNAGLYADCQDGALAVGEYIEGIEGEGTQTVALLENYCDELYRVSIGESDKKQLEAVFTGVCESVRIELKPNKIEVLFLPYKRAMSDSLESIWQAALRDPGCDAYIMPVPYYDRLPGGAFGQMHYEGDLYPPDLPITDWREYDIEARRPDIIFIHYPYDDGNYVTSLHPDFYSKRLKSFTDLLTYVPYFVCIDDVEEHFCVCAGTLYADKVIVQSEKVRQTYIDNFRKFEKRQKRKGKYGKPTEKFIALGSPKLDAVISSKHEDFTIPEEWAKLIDGKKVVFYNTTIGSVLKGNEQHLEKVRSTLDIFRRRDDVLLWWRPHPLNSPAYQSMRPRLLEEYEQIIESYKHEGFGIYDDTAELHRAIAMSDAYYGDLGSLAAMYLLTGKPFVNANNYSLPESARTNALISECFVDTGDYIYFSAFYWNALFKITKQTWTAEYLGSFPDEKPNAVLLFRNAVLFNGKLYFAPFSADGIGIYDIAADEFISIPVDEPSIKNKPYYNPIYKFNSVTENSGNLWFFPASYPAVMCLNTVTGEIRYLTDWVTRYDRLRSDTYGWFCGLNTAECDGKLYAPSLSAEVLISADAISGEIEVKSIKCAEHNLCLCLVGGDLWLTPRLTPGERGYVTKYNLLTEESTNIPLPDTGTLDAEYARAGLFKSIALCGNKIWLFPVLWNETVCIGTDTGEAQTADAFTPEHVSEAIPVNLALKRFATAWEHGGKLYAVGGRSGKIIEYDPSTGERTEHTLTADIDDALKNAFFKDFTACEDIGDFIYCETEVFEGDKVIDHVLYQTHDSEKQTRLAAERYLTGDGNAGDKIWDYCTEEVLKKR